MHSFRSCPNEGGRALPKLFGTFARGAFLVNKGASFFQNANNFNFKLFFSIHMYTHSTIYSLHSIFSPKLIFKSWKKSCTSCPNGGEWYFGQNSKESIFSRVLSGNCSQDKDLICFDIRPVMPVVFVKPSWPQLQNQFSLFVLFQLHFRVHFSLCCHYCEQGPCFHSQGE